MGWPAVSRPFLITAALALAVTFFACGAPVIAPTTPTAAPTPTPHALTADGVLDRTRLAIAALESFHFRLTHSSGMTVLPGGFAVRDAEGTIDNPDRLALTSDTVFGGVFIKIDVVVLPNVTYMTNPLTGNWNEITPEESPFAVFDPSGLIADILEQVESNQFAGESPVVDGLYRLSGTIPGGALRGLVGDVESGRTLKYQMSIDPTAFHMLEVRLIGALNPSEDAGVDRTIELSQFDVPVNIESPI